MTHLRFPSHLKFQNTQSLKNKKKKKEKTLLYPALALCLPLIKETKPTCLFSLFLLTNKTNRIPAPDATTNHMSRASSREQRNFRDHTETVIGPNDIMQAHFYKSFFFFLNLCILIWLLHESRCSIKN